MRRVRDLIGLPVLAGRQMRRIGRVQAALLTDDGAQIHGLVLEGGWPHPRRVLDYRAVYAVGETHLLAAEERYLTQQSGAHEPAGARRCDQLQGLPVLNESGEELGVMDDVHFDPSTGQVTALQLSHGLVDDLISGKEILPLAGPLLTGEAAILLGKPGDLSGGAVW